MVFRHRLLIGSKRNHSPTPKQDSRCSLKLAGSLARAQGGLTTCWLPFRAGVVFFPLRSCRFYLKGPSYSFQVLSQLSDKKQTEKAALTVSPRAKACTSHKHRRNSGVGPKTKVQAGRRRCRPRHRLWCPPGLISFNCSPYSRPVATAWLCLAFWQTLLEPQQTLQTA